MAPPDKARHYVHDLHYPGLPLEEVYVVWFCYILGGWKALVSTTVLDNRYYEVTFDQEKKRTYVDCYRKVTNITVPENGLLSATQVTLDD